MKHNYSVIIPTQLSPKPHPKEISAAYILADYFKSNVTFVIRTQLKTADFLIKGSYWELKTPTGTGKRTIQHTIQSAIRQSNQIIIDARFSRMHITSIKNQLQHYLLHAPRIKHLLLIGKDKKVIEIKRQKC